MRTPTEKDDALLRPPAQARAAVSGFSRALGVALIIAPLLALLVVFGTPGVVHAGGGNNHAITIAPDNGPAGTHVTVSGGNFPKNSDVTIGYGSGGCASGVTNISGATGTTDGNGNLKVSFGWPSTPAGDYRVCVTVGGTTSPSDNVFTATSPNAPAITVSSPVASGGQVTVTGTNFLLKGDQTVTVTYGPQGSNGCASPGGSGAITNGGFTVTFNAPAVTADTQYVVTAVTPDGSCGGAPTLSAQGNLTVSAGATPTTVPTVAPTATTPGGSTGGAGGAPGLSWPPTWPPSGAWSVVYCLAGLLLLLLLLLLALLFARNRRKDEPVTIQERDNVTVASSGDAGQAGGTGAVRRDVEAVDPRTGRRTVIASDEYTFEEVPDDQQ